LNRVFGNDFQARRLLGGASECQYRGEYQIENLGLTARVTVSYNGGVDPTPFGSNGRLDVNSSAVLRANLERNVLLLEAVIAEPEAPQRKLLYRRGRASHSISHAPSLPSGPSHRPRHRRQFSDANHCHVLAEKANPGASVSQVANHCGRRVIASKESYSL